MWKWIIRLYRRANPSLKHPCPEVFRMDPLTPLGADLLALHMRNTRSNFGSWGR